ncbi:MAG: hypothetical protein QOI42_512, partial [Frankiaceae bacterium]|nr:hypothetical protein [Frankiaceae bacterium]
MRTHRARRALGSVATIATVGLLAGGVLAPAPAAYAGHGHGPSARQVAAGKAAVARREHQVAAAAGRVQATKAELGRLNTAAEVAVEDYNQARVKQRAAQRDADLAKVVLRVAAHHVTVARNRVGHFAAAAYMSGGLSSVDAMLGADGPESLLYRVNTLNVISRAQRDATQALDA